MYPFLKDASFRPWFLICACDTSVLQNFKIFTHLLPNYPSLTKVTYHWIPNALTSTIGSKKLFFFYYFGAIFWNHDQEKKKYDAIKTKISLIFFIMISHYTQVCASSEGLLWKIIQRNVTNLKNYYHFAILFIVDEIK